MMDAAIGSLVFVQIFICIQICDSLNVSLTQGKSVQALYKKNVNDDRRMTISFLPVQKHATYDCDLFTIAFSCEVLDEKSPVDAVFDVQNLWTHSIQCLSNQNLVVFSKRKVRILALNGLIISDYRFT